jgi:hypothetical protein
MEWNLLSQELTAMGATLEVDFELGADPANRKHPL